MKVTMIANQRLQAIWENVSSYAMKGTNLVELLRVTLWKNTVGGVVVEAVPPYVRDYPHYSTIAIVHLAPGEYLEWSEDEPKS